MTTPANEYTARVVAIQAVLAPLAKMFGVIVLLLVLVFIVWPFILMVSKEAFGWPEGEVSRGYSPAIFVDWLASLWGNVADAVKWLGDVVEGVGSVLKSIIFFMLQVIAFLIFALFVSRVVAPSLSLTNLTVRAGRRNAPWNHRTDTPVLAGSALIFIVVLFIAAFSSGIF
jgi:hypothetical protein